MLSIQAVRGLPRLKSNENKLKTKHLLPGRIGIVSIESNLAGKGLRWARRFSGWGERGTARAVYQQSENVSEKKE